MREGGGGRGRWYAEGGRQTLPQFYNAPQEDGGCGLNHRTDSCSNSNSSKSSMSSGSRSSSNKTTPAASPSPAYVQGNHEFSSRTVCVAPSPYGHASVTCSSSGSTCTPSPTLDMLQQQVLPYPFSRMPRTSPAFSVVPPHLYAAPKPRPSAAAGSAVCNGVSPAVTATERLPVPARLPPRARIVLAASNDAQSLACSAVPAPLVVATSATAPPAAPSAGVALTAGTGNVVGYEGPFNVAGPLSRPDSSTIETCVAESAALIQTPPSSAAPCTAVNDVGVAAAANTLDTVIPRVSLPDVHRFASAAAGPVTSSSPLRASAPSCAAPVQSTHTVAAVSYPTCSASVAARSLVAAATPPSVHVPVATTTSVPLLTETPTVYVGKSAVAGPPFVGGTASKRCNGAASGAAAATEMTGPSVKSAACNYDVSLNAAVATAAVSGTDTLVVAGEHSSAEAAAPLAACRTLISSAVAQDYAVLPGSAAHPPSRVSSQAESLPPQLYPASAVVATAAAIASAPLSAASPACASAAASRRVVTAPAPCCANSNAEGSATAMSAATAPGGHAFLAGEASTDHVRLSAAAAATTSSLLGASPQQWEQRQSYDVGNSGARVKKEQRENPRAIAAADRMAQVAHVQSVTHSAAAAAAMTPQLTKPSSYGQSAYAEGAKELHTDTEDFCVQAEAMSPDQRRQQHPRQSVRRPQLDAQQHTTTQKQQEQHTVRWQPYAAHQQQQQQYSPADNSRAEQHEQQQPPQQPREDVPALPLMEGPTPFETPMLRCISSFGSTPARGSPEPLEPQGSLLQQQQQCTQEERLCAGQNILQQLHPTQYSAKQHHTHGTPQQQHDVQQQTTGTWQQPQLPHVENQLADSGGLLQPKNRLLIENGQRHEDTPCTHKSRVQEAAATFVQQKHAHLASAHGHLQQQPHGTEWKESKRLREDWLQCVKAIPQQRDAYGRQRHQQAARQQHEVWRQQVRQGDNKAKQASSKVHNQPLKAVEDVSLLHVELCGTAAKERCAGRSGSIKNRHRHSSQSSNTREHIASSAHHFSAVASLAAPDHPCTVSSFPAAPRPVPGGGVPAVAAAFERDAVATHENDVSATAAVMARRQRHSRQQCEEIENRQQQQYMRQRRHWRSPERQQVLQEIYNFADDHMSVDRPYSQQREEHRLVDCRYVQQQEGNYRLVECRNQQRKDNDGAFAADKGICHSPLQRRSSTEVAAPTGRAARLVINELAEQASAARAHSEEENAFEDAAGGLAASSLPASSSPTHLCAGGQCSGKAPEEGISLSGYTNCSVSSSYTREEYSSSSRCSSSSSRDKGGGTSSESECDSPYTRCSRSSSSGISSSGTSSSGISINGSSSSGSRSSSKCAIRSGSTKKFSCIEGGSSSRKKMYRRRNRSRFRSCSKEKSLASLDKEPQVSLRDMGYMEKPTAHNTTRIELYTGILHAEAATVTRNQQLHQQPREQRRLADDSKQQQHQQDPMTQHEVLAEQQQEKKRQRRRQVRQGRFHASPQLQRQQQQQQQQHQQYTSGQLNPQLHQQPKQVEDGNVAEGLSGKESEQQGLTENVTECRLTGVAAAAQLLRRAYMTSRRSAAASVTVSDTTRRATASAPNEDPLRVISSVCRGNGVSSTSSNRGSLAAAAAALLARPLSGEEEGANSRDMFTRVAGKGEKQVGSNHCRNTEGRRSHCGAVDECSSTSSTNHHRAADSSSDATWTSSTISLTNTSRRESCINNSSCSGSSSCTSRSSTQARSSSRSKSSSTRRGGSSSSDSREEPRASRSSDSREEPRASRSTCFRETEGGQHGENPATYSLGRKKEDETMRRKQGTRSTHLKETRLYYKRGAWKNLNHSDSTSSSSRERGDDACASFPNNADFSENMHSSSRDGRRRRGCKVSSSRTGTSISSHRSETASNGSCTRSNSCSGVKSSRRINVQKATACEEEALDRKTSKGVSSGSPRRGGRHLVNSASSRSRSSETNTPHSSSCESSVAGGANGAATMFDLSSEDVARSPPVVSSSSQSSNKEKWVAAAAAAEASVPVAKTAASAAEATAPAALARTATAEATASAAETTAIAAVAAPAAETTGETTAAATDTAAEAAVQPKTPSGPSLKVVAENFSAIDDAVAASPRKVKAAAGTIVSSVWSKRLLGEGRTGGDEQEQTEEEEDEKYFLQARRVRSTSASIQQAKHLLHQQQTDQQNTGTQQKPLLKQSLHGHQIPQELTREFIQSRRHRNNKHKSSGLQQPPPQHWPEQQQDRQHEQKGPEELTQQCELEAPHQQAHQSARRENKEAGEQRLHLLQQHRFGETCEEEHHSSCPVRTGCRRAGADACKMTKMQQQDVLPGRTCDNNNSTSWGNEEEKEEASIERKPGDLCEGGCCTSTDDSLLDSHDDNNSVHGGRGKATVRETELAPNRRRKFPREQTRQSQRRSCGRLCRRAAKERALHLQLQEENMQLCIRLRDCCSLLGQETAFRQAAQQQELRAKAEIEEMKAQLLQLQQQVQQAASASLLAASAHSAALPCMRCVAYVHEERPSFPTTAASEAKDKFDSTRKDFECTAPAKCCTRAALKQATAAGSLVTDADSVRSFIHEGAEAGATASTENPPLQAYALAAPPPIVAATAARGISLLPCGAGTAEAAGAPETSEEEAAASSATPGRTSKSSGEKEDTPVNAVDEAAVITAAEASESSETQEEEGRRASTVQPQAQAKRKGSAEKAPVTAHQHGKGVERNPGVNKEVETQPAATVAAAATRNRGDRHSSRECVSGKSRSHSAQSSCFSFSTQRPRHRRSHKKKEKKRKKKRLHSNACKEKSAGSPRPHRCAADVVAGDTASASGDRVAEAAAAAATVAAVTVVAAPVPREEACILELAEPEAVTTGAMQTRIHDTPRKMSAAGGTKAEMASQGAPGGAAPEARTSRRRRLHVNYTHVPSSRRTPTSSAAEPLQLSASLPVSAAAVPTDDSTPAPFLSLSTSSSSSINRNRSSNSNRSSYSNNNSKPRTMEGTLSSPLNCTWRAAVSKRAYVLTSAGAVETHRERSDACKRGTSNRSICRAEQKKDGTKNDGRRKDAAGPETAEVAAAPPSKSELPTPQEAAGFKTAPSAAAVEKTTVAGSDTTTTTKAKVRVTTAAHQATTCSSRGRKKERVLEDSSVVSTPPSSRLRSPTVPSAVNVVRVSTAAGTVEAPQTAAARPPATITSHVRGSKSNRPLLFPLSNVSSKNVEGAVERKAQASSAASGGATACVMGGVPGGRHRTSPTEHQSLRSLEHRRTSCKEMRQQYHLDDVEKHAMKEKNTRQPQQQQSQQQQQQHKRQHEQQRQQQSKHHHQEREERTSRKQLKKHGAEKQDKLQERGRPQQQRAAASLPLRHVSPSANSSYSSDASVTSVSSPHPPYAAPIVHSAVSSSASAALGFHRAATDFLGVSSSSDSVASSVTASPVCSVTGPAACFSPAVSSSRPSASSSEHERERSAGNYGENKDNTDVRQVDRKAAPLPLAKNEKEVDDEELKTKKRRQRRHQSKHSRQSTRQRLPLGQSIVEEDSYCPVGTTHAVQPPKMSGMKTHKRKTAAVLTKDEARKGAELIYRFEEGKNAKKKETEGEGYTEGVQELSISHAYASLQAAGTSVSTGVSTENSSSNREESPQLSQDDTACVTNTERKKALSATEGEEEEEAAEAAVSGLKDSLTAEEVCASTSAAVLSTAFAKAARAKSLAEETKACDVTKNGRGKARASYSASEEKHTQRVGVLQRQQLSATATESHIAERRRNRKENRRSKHGKSSDERRCQVSNTASSLLKAQDSNNYDAFSAVAAAPHAPSPNGPACSTTASMLPCARTAATTTTAAAATVAATNAAATAAAARATAAPATAAAAVVGHRRRTSAHSDSSASSLRSDERTSPPAIRTCYGGPATGPLGASSALPPPPAVAFPSTVASVSAIAAPSIASGSAMTAEAIYSQANSSSPPPLHVGVPPPATSSLFGWRAAVKSPAVQQTGGLSRASSNNACGSSSHVNATKKVLDVAGDKRFGSGAVVSEAAEGLIAGDAVAADRSREAISNAGSWVIKQYAQPCHIENTSRRLNGSAGTSITERCGTSCSVVAAATITSPVAALLHTTAATASHGSRSRLSNVSWHSIQDKQQQYYSQRQLHTRQQQTCQQPSQPQQHPQQQPQHDYTHKDMQPQHEYAQKEMMRSRRCSIWRNSYEGTRGQIDDGQRCAAGAAVLEEDEEASGKAAQVLTPANTGSACTQIEEAVPRNLSDPTLYVTSEEKQRGRYRDGDKYPLEDDVCSSGQPDLSSAGASSRRSGKGERQSLRSTAAGAPGPLEGAKGAERHRQQPLQQGQGDTARFVLDPPQQRQQNAYTLPEQVDHASAPKPQATSSSRQEETQGKGSADLKWQQQQHAHQVHTGGRRLAEQRGHTQHTASHGNRQCQPPECLRQLQDLPEQQGHQGRCHKDIVQQLQQQRFDQCHQDLQGQQIPVHNICETQRPQRYLRVHGEGAELSLPSSMQKDTTEEVPHRLANSDARKQQRPLPVVEESLPSLAVSQASFGSLEASACSAFSSAAASTTVATSAAATTSACASSAAPFVAAPFVPAATTAVQDEEEKETRQQYGKEKSARRKRREQKRNEHRHYLKECSESEKFQKQGRTYQLHHQQQVQQERTSTSGQSQGRGCGHIVDSADKVDVPEAAETRAPTTLSIMCPHTHRSSNYMAQTATEATEETDVGCAAQQETEVHAAATLPIVSMSAGQAAVLTTKRTAPVTPVVSCDPTRAANERPAGQPACRTTAVAVDDAQEVALTTIERPQRASEVAVAVTVDGTADAATTAGVKAAATAPACGLPAAPATKGRPDCRLATAIGEDPCVRSGAALADRHAHHFDRRRAFAAALQQPVLQARVAAGDASTSRKVTPATFSSACIPPHATGRPAVVASRPPPPAVAAAAPVTAGGPNCINICAAPASAADAGPAASASTAARKNTATKKQSSLEAAPVRDIGSRRGVAPASKELAKLQEPLLRSAQVRTPTATVGGPGAAENVKLETAAAEAMESPQSATSAAKERKRLATRRRRSCNTMSLHKRAPSSDYSRYVPAVLPSATNATAVVTAASPSPLRDVIARSTSPSHTSGGVAGSAAAATAQAGCGAKSGYVAACSSGRRVDMLNTAPATSSSVIGPDSLADKSVSGTVSRSAETAGRQDCDTASARCVCAADVGASAPKMATAAAAAPAGSVSAPTGTAAATARVTGSKSSGGGEVNDTATASRMSGGAYGASAAATDVIRNVPDNPAAAVGTSSAQQRSRVAGRVETVTERTERKPRAGTIPASAAATSGPVAASSSAAPVTIIRIVKREELARPRRQPSAAHSTLRPH